MLGDIGYEVPLGPAGSDVDSRNIRPVFTVNGRMVRYKGNLPVSAQNRTINAIVVAERYYEVSSKPVRCVVHENPYARMPLPQDLFIGPYDERYGADREGQIVRLYAGDAVARFDRSAM